MQKGYSLDNNFNQIAKNVNSTPNLNITLNHNSLFNVIFFHFRSHPNHAMSELALQGILLCCKTNKMLITVLMNNAVIFIVLESQSSNDINIFTF